MATEDTQDNENTQTNNDQSEPEKTKRRNRQPDGQTAAGSSELGDASDFENPSTPLEGQIGRAVTRETRVAKGESESLPDLVSKVTKALGHKSSNVLGYNERTRVIVYDNGAKYQISKNGKSLRHLSGPKPSADLKLNVVDATSRGFSGAAAAINAPATVEQEDPDALRSRRDALRAELEELDSQLED